MLTVVTDTSLMKITMHLILRGEATYKSYRAVITHILTEPKKLTCNTKLPKHKPIVLGGWEAHLSQTGCSVSGQFLLSQLF